MTPNNRQKVIKKIKETIAKKQREKKDIVAQIAILDLELLLAKQKVQLAQLAVDQARVKKEEAKKKLREAKENMHCLQIGFTESSSDEEPEGAVERIVVPTGGSESGQSQQNKLPEEEVKISFIESRSQQELTGSDEEH